MGTELNANILGVKRASELTKLTGNLDSVYNLANDDAKKLKLFETFSQKYFNSTTEKANIENQIKALEEKIADFDKQIEEIEKAIEGKEDEIKELKNTISETVAKIVLETEEYEDSYKREIDKAVDIATDNYRNKSNSSLHQAGGITFEQFLMDQMNQVTSNQAGAYSGIQALIESMSDPQNKLNGLIKDMEDEIKGADMLNDQYATTKSTLDLLKLTKDNMTSAAGSYQTADTDPSVPIFTPAKEELADGYLATYTSRLANRENNEAAVTTNAEKKAEVKNKYAAMVKPQTPGADPYSMKNAQLASFSNAINSGMIEEMSEAGYSKKEILDNINEMFGSIGISHGDDGRPVIPWGHGSDAQAVYRKFEDSFKKVEGAVQRDDLQIAEMDKAIKNDKIVTEMKNSNFSWKECAYTLTRLWPGGGIDFTLGEKEITLPIGDNKSKGTYDALESEIKKNYPDVKVNRGTSDETVKDEVKHTDPIGFNIGDKSYEFAIDRNQDGKLNDFTEMVGANGLDGMKEMAQFDKDGDGHISGDELDNLLVLNTEHTNRDYEFLTASQLGIKDIDLSSFKEKSQTRPDGSDAGDFININNSLIAGTFNITLDNGKSAEGYQKYVTEDYMKAVYDPILGENIYSQLDAGKVSNVINENFDQAAEKLENINDLMDLIGGKEQFGDIKAALRTKLNNATNEIYGHKAKTMSEATGAAYTEEFKKNLEMSVQESEDVINQYLEGTDGEKKVEEGRAEYEEFIKQWYGEEEVEK